MIRSFKGVRPTVPESCFVDESAQIIGDVVLGEHASVWMNAVVRGDVFAIRIGAHSNIQDCSVLHGMKNVYGVTVGEYVTVGHSVTLHGCVIEDRCLWMGSPGKFRRKLENGEEELIMRYARNYLGYTEEYLRER
jgi:carbonic anhydrase/acetyltransferase-like protein (isoleucine patch superfamily)